MALDRSLQGKRVELVYTSDTYTRLKPGAQGTIAFCDDLGTVFVDWDDGSTLGLVPGEDTYRFV